MHARPPLRAGIKLLLTRLSERQHRLRFNPIRQKIEAYGKRVPIRYSIRDLLIIKSLQEHNRLSFMKTVIESDTLDLITTKFILNLSQASDAELDECSGDEFDRQLDQKIDEEIDNVFRSKEPILALDRSDLLMLTKENFRGWIHSVCAPSVSKSYYALENLLIPHFISSDIVMRTPISKKEYLLQLDVWNEFMRQICIANFKRPQYIKRCIQNLLYYGVHFDTSKLAPVLSKTFDYLQSEKGYNFKILDKDYLNGLIWQMTFDFYRRNPNSECKHAFNDLIASQEVVVNYLKRLSPNTPPLDLLGHQSQLGVVMALNKISPQKATKLLTMIEPKHAHTVSYHSCKLLLAGNTEELLRRFNQIDVSHLHRSSLWYFFVRRLYELNSLTSERSMKIMQQLFDHGRVLVSKDLVILLLKPIDTISQLNSFMRLLPSQDYKGTLLIKYLALLYKQTKKKSSANRKADNMEIFADLNAKLGVGLLEYTRAVYNEIPPSMSKINVMLNSESTIDPTGFYERYTQAIGSSSPNEACLNALITAASQGPVWGQLHASEIAIKEFNNHVMFQAPRGRIKNVDNDTRIFPTDSLWQNYILMLLKYNHISELADITRRWESLQFVPEPNSLLMLLRALPREHASRLLQHAQMVADGSPAQWPWPSAEQIESSQFLSVI